MMLCGAPSGLACRYRAPPIHDFQTVGFLAVAFFDKNKRSMDQPTGFLLKQPIHITQVLAPRLNLKQQTVVLALRKEDDGANGITSQSYQSNEILFPSEKGESATISANIAASISHPENFKYALTEGSILDKMKAVLLHILASERWNTSRLKLCNRNYLASANNLIHYLALKYLDVEQLKEDLSSVGLLNLDTINPHVLASLTSGIQNLENLNSASVTSATKTGDIIKKGKYEVQIMRKKASHNAELILGPLQDGSTHIMATVGQEATESESLIHDLLNAGTSIIRINCAHGNPSLWSEIIRQVKRSSQMLEKACRILLDLAGPKLRTGKSMPGPCVMKISPKRSATGNVIHPAEIWISHKGAGPIPAHLSPDAVIFIDNPEFLSKLEVGDVLRFRDARQKKRMLKISRKYHVFSGTGLMAECSNTSYIQSGTDLYTKKKRGKILVGQVVDVPPLDTFVRLKVGDLLVISRDNSCDQEQLGMTGCSHRVTCSSGLLFDSVKPGEVIAFDDGKIWGVIKGTSTSEIVASISHAGAKGTKLGSDKSINIPESNIQFEGLTSKDLMDLEFVAAHADMVGISFIQDVQDIVVLRQVLAKRKFRNLGIVLKIETRSGFENLPLLLLEAMKSPNPLAVMIARGDLAVECGWERLAEIQEEILSVCQAAHVPVIWATQVLESLVKSGVPTRAELTDVASGSRANCIMLNKGKHIVEAVSSLNTILQRSSSKTKAEMKPLLLPRQESPSFVK